MAQPEKPNDEDNTSQSRDIPGHANNEGNQSQNPEIKDSSSSIAQEHNPAVDQSSPITWHYLTFETSLPSLSQPYGASEHSSPPKCPDLKQYTSPFLWSDGRKSFIIWLSCIATALAAYTAGSYAPAIPQMIQEWHVSETAAAVGITTFTCGFAIAPMALAPFSEEFGRRPVFVITGLLWIVLQLACGLTRTYAGMLVARFFVGCVSSTFSTMVGGVVADLYVAKDRNQAMAMFTGAALAGTGIGPLISGFIGQNTTWRWIFYLQTCTCGLLMVFIVPLFKETRGSVLLSRKARALNLWYEELESSGHYGFDTFVEKSLDKTTQRIRWKVKADEERGTMAQMIRVSLSRPFHLLFTEPVVFWFSLWVSFAWGILYLLFSAVPLLFESNHGFSLQQANSVFAAVTVAAIISVPASIYQEKLARKYSPRQELLDSPEGRLYFCCVQSILLPVGCFWFGWTSFPSDAWILPALAIGCVTMGIFSIYLAVFLYLADAYHKYASSALAAQSFCRNLLGGVFPLFTPQMFRGLTFQGAGSLLGGLAAALTVVPWVLLLWGPRIRAKSKFASALIKDGGD